jgi:hypothetical protein
MTNPRNAPDAVSEDFVRWFASVQHAARFNALIFGVLFVLAGSATSQAQNLPPALNFAVPPADYDAILHNPDMGWVVYENYPLDQDPRGSSTLLTLPNENFDKVDAVAIMFSWQDIEKKPDEYDFSKVDYAYDYWAKRGKSIQLRLSTTTLMWWAHRKPPTGSGAPEYVRAQLAANEKQQRDLDGTSYDVDDTRNPYYCERLEKFLRAVDAHFSKKRPVTLIDLRGFGVWGEWHSGFKYATLEERRDALKKVIDIWCRALPKRALALSASYDPDGPPELYEGNTRHFDKKWTKHYDEFLKYSAFDYALTKPNICFRRDGCDGAVHSNERQLIREFYALKRGPIVCEFMNGFSDNKHAAQSKKLDDALSLHPNYICLLGWQGADALAFLQEREYMVDIGLRKMGYRLVPVGIHYPGETPAGRPMQIHMEWENRGVGRALRDFELRLALANSDGAIVARARPTVLPTSKWLGGERQKVPVKAQFPRIAPGQYELVFGLWDTVLEREIQMPLQDKRSNGLYYIGTMEVTAP